VVLAEVNFQAMFEAQQQAQQGQGGGNGSGVIANA
jgi:preprotein translocase subunit SecB